MLSLFTRNIPFDHQHQRAKIGLWLGLSVFLILIIFQPYGTYEFRSEAKYLMLGGYGVLVFLGYVSFWEVALLWVNKDAWTFGKEVLALVLMVCFVATLSFVYHRLFFSIQDYSLGSYFGFLSRCASIAAIPVGFRLYNVWKSLPREIPQQEVEKVQQPIASPSVEPITLTGTNRTDTITCDPGDLRLIQSMDNYVEVWYRKGGDWKKTTLRNTMKELEKQVEALGFERVHRSALLRVDQLKSLKISGAKTMAHFREPGLPEVPISRSKVADIRTRLAEKT
ncbi:LytTR family DNA-binding domain-containing protein [Pontibacter sp. G13]|uniref:LytTR family DNA-binding domain-containing protein n=1 Tax=Pontibacter sp. G13 TaxID=3074898 RepID=UPI00288A2F1D|nr:LytTR family DNA-binding domain-containing protein [Pontibacter sp. G13]WNJ19787.1 LytTR family DNA-binding domain-containing protein [Pontibacter sp. G13]